MTPISGTPIPDEFKREGLLPAEVRLLYANSTTALVVTVIAATTLGRLQWSVVPKFIVFIWWLYMTLVSAWRFIVARRYSRASQDCDSRKWRAAFVMGAALAGTGWGA